MKHGVQKLEALVSAAQLPVTEYLEIPLSRRATYRTEGDSRGVKLICLDGLVWITQAGDPTDYLLSAGRSFTVTYPGTVLIQGLPTGRLRLIPVIHGLSATRHSRQIRSSMGMLGLVGR